MPNKLRAFLVLMMLGTAVALTLASCGKGGGSSADVLDESKLENGQSTTLALKFWMKARSSTSDGILVDNMHFFDKNDQRFVGGIAALGQVAGGRP